MCWGRLIPLPIIFEDREMNDSLKEVAAFLGMIGVPSIFIMTSWCIKSCVGFFKQLKILQEQTVFLPMN